MINATLSFHMGANHNEKHDLRQDTNIKYVDKSRSANNYYQENCLTKEQAYDELFSEALAEYNARQKRDDRKIANYLSKVQAAEEKQKNNLAELKRSGATYSELAKNSKVTRSSYQFIVSIGNRQDNPEFNSKSGEKRNDIKEIFINYIKNFEQRNPNVRLYCSAVHMDEGGYSGNNARFGDNDGGVVHLHCSVIFYADGFKKGLKRQVSQNQALKAMGFESDTCKGSDGKMHLAIEKWQNREREVLKELCKEKGINIIAGNEKRSYLDREHYIIQQQQKENLQQKTVNEKASEFVEEQAKKILDYKEKVSEQYDSVKNFLIEKDLYDTYYVAAEHKRIKKENENYKEKNEMQKDLLAHYWGVYKAENSAYWKAYRIKKDEIFRQLKKARKELSEKNNNDSIFDELFALIDKLLFGLIRLIASIVFCYNEVSLEQKVENLTKENDQLKKECKRMLKVSQEMAGALYDKDIEHIENMFDVFNGELETINSDIKDIMQQKMLEESEKISHSL